MDVEGALRKLEPLMPLEVRHWRRQRATATPPLRALIERHVLHTAFEVLEDPEAVLLSLPPKKASRGPIALGRLEYSGVRHDFGLRLEEVLQHTAIFGRSGAGKTNALFVLLEGILRKDVQVLFWDFKRTARHWIASRGIPARVYTPGRPLAPFSFAPFQEPAGLERETYHEQVIDVLASAYTLGDGACSVIRKALASLDRAVSTTRLLEAVHAIDATARSQAWKTSAVRALETLQSARLDEGPDALELHPGCTVVELDALGASNRKFILPVLCLHLYYAQLAHPQRERARLVVVIEEAHNVLGVNPRRGRESVLEMLLRQSREIGMAFVIVTQEPTHVSSAVLANTHTSIVMNLKNPSDRRIAVGLSGLSEREANAFANLEVGEGIVRLQTRWTKPVRIRFPHVRIEKGRVEDSDVQVLNQRARAQTGTRRAKSSESWRGRRGPSDEVPLSGPGLRLLADVLVHPDDGVKQRYKRLDLTSHTGTKAQRELLQGGLVRALVVPVGTSRKTVLVPTKSAQEVRGTGGVAHTYWQGYYARAYQKAGWKVTRESRLGGGRVDVLARRNYTTRAIEIETGRSTYLENVRACLRAGCEVHVVATTRQVLERIETALIKAHLLIPGRVRLGLHEAMAPGGREA